jgi:hypothetical protein
MQIGPSHEKPTLITILLLLLLSCVGQDTHNRTFSEWTIVTFLETQIYIYII